MTWFKDDERLDRNPAFVLEEGGAGGGAGGGVGAGAGGRAGAPFRFVHESGEDVSTDAFGAALWECLPGTAGEIRERLAAKADVSARTADDFLYLMLRAGLINAKNTGTHHLIVLKSGHLSLSAVSAVIVTLNGERHIRACLASLRAQTRRPAEVLLVDNGSTDKTLEIVRNEFPEVLVHALPKNLFYPGGVNHGISKTKSEFILVLNDDTELEPDAVGEMARVMAADDRAAAVVPMMKLFNLRGFLNGIGNHVRPKGWGSDNFVGCVDAGQFDSLSEVPSACLSAVLLRREAVLDVGFFDEGYRAYYEDPDWSFRARLRGWKIGAAPRAVVYHKFSAYWGSMERKLKLAAKNRQRFVVKVFWGRHLGAFLRSYLKEDAKNFLSLVKRRRWSVALAYPRAYGALVWGLPADLIKRRAVMKRRVPGVGIQDILDLNPVHWTCLDERNRPVLDIGTYFRYYRWVLR
jgi:GT2 family glycosyltransferase